MDKVERVARAMCRARGINPDDDSRRGPLVTRTHRTSTQSANFTQERAPLPNWQLLQEEAIDFVAAYEALAISNEC